MRPFFYLLPCLVLLLSACNMSEKELSPEEKQQRDSLSRIAQKHKVDSLKQLNPLLIMPPDSIYTGDYVDKYPNGIIKFKGYYRLGQQHGQWLSFYPNGIAWSEMHFDKGLRHGMNVTYYESGKTRYEGFYKNDQRDSIWNYYDSTGHMAQRVVFKNDRILRKLPPQ